MPQAENRSLAAIESQAQSPSPVPTPAPIPTSPEAMVISGVIDLTKEAMRCFTSYLACKEHEITERKRITAMLRAVEYQIDAQKEVYLKELDKKFEERNRLYDMAEKAQELALELGDKEMLQMCYNLILNVYNGSIKADTTGRALSTNGFTLLDSLK